MTIQALWKEAGATLLYLTEHQMAVSMYCFSDLKTSGRTVTFDKILDIER